MSWQSMDTAPRDETLVLLAYHTWDGYEMYDVGAWVPNYGCPGWRTTGSFVHPVAWMAIPKFDFGSGADDCERCGTGREDDETKEEDGR